MATIAPVQRSVELITLTRRDGSKRTIKADRHAALEAARADGKDQDWIDWLEL